MMRVGVTLWALLAVVKAGLPDQYILGKQGDSCAVACSKVGQQCSTSVVTDNSNAIFAKVGVTCTKTSQGGKWWADDQPSYVSGANDPGNNSGDCLGYIDVPPVVNCAGSFPTTERICHCTGDIKDECWFIPGGEKPCWDNTSATALTFGTGLSGGTLPAIETTLFAHQIDADGAGGQLTHFWSTCSPAAENSMMVRYYIDNETSPSIEFHPSMAAGVGFGDGTAPWGTKWAGLGAGHGGGQAWFNNFKIPFTSSVRVTIQSMDGKSYNGFYMIIRGGLGLPLVIGEVPLPKTAKLQLQKFEGPLKPLEWLDVVSVPKGKSGQVFMTAISVNNSGIGGYNFLEGCYHWYDPIDAAFPGTLLATGTEDFFDSGWYFNAGEFRFPVSGFTHGVTEKNVTEWSAYRFHEMDPLRFSDGVRMTWRCGDITAGAPNGGDKCFAESLATGGRPVGNPTCDHVISYGWVYVF